MSEGRPTIAIVILVACLILPGVYVGAYFATARPQLNVQRKGEFVFADYTIGGEYAQRLFFPMHALDRRWRPSSREAEAFRLQPFRPDSAVKIETFGPIPRDQRVLNLRASVRLHGDGSWDG